MPRCIHCGSALTRSRRSAWEKLFYKAAYRCIKCAERMREPAKPGSQFSMNCQCPRCGNPNPSIRLKRDKIDKMLRSPLRFMHRLLGGTLYHCAYCRLQFYDVRKRKESEKSQVKAAGDPTHMASGD